MAATEEEVVRWLFAALTEGVKHTAAVRHEWAPTLFTDDAVYREDPRWPGAGVYHGREDILRCWEGYLEVFDHPVLEVVNVESSGGKAIATVNFRSPVGEMPVTHTWAYVIVVRDERVQSLDAYLDPDEARAATQEELN